MIRKSRQKRDKILEDLHNQYINDPNNSGFTESITSMYGYSPLCVSLSQERDTPALDHNKKQAARSRKKSK
jgi:hypothetical protein